MVMNEHASAMVLLTDVVLVTWLCWSAVNHFVPDRNFLMDLMISWFPDDEDYQLHAMRFTYLIFLEVSWQLNTIANTLKFKFIGTC